MAQEQSGDTLDPDYLQEIFCEGVHLTVLHGLVHFVGWQITEGGDKRIVVRTVLPEHVVRLMTQQIVAKLPPQH